MTSARFLLELADCVVAAEEASRDPNLQGVICEGVEEGCLDPMIRMSAISTKSSFPLGSGSGRNDFCEDPENCALLL